jgi:hypothetical protein
MTKEIQMFQCQSDSVEKNAIGNMEMAGFFEAPQLKRGNGRGFCGVRGQKCGNGRRFWGFNAKAQRRGGAREGIGNIDRTAFRRFRNGKQKIMWNKWNCGPITLKGERERSEIWVETQRARTSQRPTRRKSVGCFVRVHSSCVVVLIGPG